MLRRLQPSAPLIFASFLASQPQKLANPTRQNRSEAASNQRLAGSSRTTSSLSLSYTYFVHGHVSATLIIVIAVVLSLAIAILSVIEFTADEDFSNIDLIKAGLLIGMASEILQKGLQEEFGNSYRIPIVLVMAIVMVFLVQLAPTRSLMKRVTFILIGIACLFFLNEASILAEKLRTAASSTAVTQQQLWANPSPGIRSSAAIAIDPF